MIIGVPPDLIDGKSLGGTGSVNFVALCSRCGVPCLAGEISNNPPKIRWGGYEKGEPVCDACYDGNPEAPNTLEKQYQNIMKRTTPPRGSGARAPLL